MKAHLSSFSKVIMAHSTLASVKLALVQNPFVPETRKSDAFWGPEGFPDGRRNDCLAVELHAEHLDSNTLDGAWYPGRRWPS